MHIVILNLSIIWVWWSYLMRRVIHYPSGYFYKWVMHRVIHHPCGDYYAWVKRPPYPTRKITVAIYKLLYT